MRTLATLLAVAVMGLGCVAKFGDKTVLGVGNVEWKRTAKTERVRGAHIGEVFGGLLTHLGNVAGSVFGGGRVGPDTVPEHEHETDEED